MTREVIGRTDLTNFQMFVEPHIAKLSPAAPTDLADDALLAAKECRESGATSGGRSRTESIGLAHQLLW